MTTLDFTQTELKQLVTHHVGNKFRDEKINLSNDFTTFKNETKDLLLKYFLLPIKTEEFYSLTHPVKLELNDIYSVVSNIFLSTDVFIPSSHDIARLLYEQSTHPKIKAGELNVAYFTNVILDGEVISAVGIFKSETGVPFLKMENEKNRFNINHDYGFEIRGMEKGCIIFNIDQIKGYRILIVDNANKSPEAQYWKDDFLKVKPIANEFHQTNQFLGLAKHFVTQGLQEDFELNKADQIDLLNRSVEYFKTHEIFDKSDFENKVFQESGIINSFQNFDLNYREENKIEIADNFEISVQAVKKQARILKSVLKLDKNFHIYIHGDRNMIEQGVDQNGRKYYKIYYQEEK